MTFDPIDFARNNILYHTGKEWPTELNKVNYILRSDGLWQVMRNKIGTFYSHVYTGKINGFPSIPTDDSVKEGFELAVPKIPRRMLSQVLAFFRQLCDDHDFEAYAQFFWNPERQEYWIRVPTQKVSKGRVEYEGQGDVDPKNVLVCEIHSHNSMDAFFSGTDDRDEKSRGDRFFGVVGKLDTSSPQIKMSYIINGERTMIELGEVIDDEEFPKEWLQQVVYLDQLPNPEFKAPTTKRSQRDDHLFWRNQEEEVEAELEELEELDIEELEEEEEEYQTETYEQPDVSKWMYQRGYNKYRMGRGI